MLTTTDKQKKGISLPKLIRQIFTFRRYASGFFSLSIFDCDENGKKPKRLLHIFFYTAEQQLFFL